MQRHKFSNVKRRGAALVEFALVLPIIAVFMVSTVSISQILMMQHTADTAAYEAARAAMVPGAHVNDAVVEAQELLDVAGLTDTEITVTPSVITEETGSVTVLVEVPLEQNSWILPDQFATHLVSSEVTLLTERSPIVRQTELPKVKAKKAKLDKKSPQI